MNSHNKNRCETLSYEIIYSLIPAWHLIFLFNVMKFIFSLFRCISRISLCLTNCKIDHDFVSSAYSTHSLLHQDCVKILIELSVAQQKKASKLTVKTIRIDAVTAPHLTFVSITFEKRCIICIYFIHDVYNTRINEHKKWLF